ncbi:sepiapterin reductase [Lepeophtheirus salmonis]|uniref:Sepiapterin reductase n=1 Tax=Lepeophtheirus salmonis TaxID=72036 RepID=D3PK33_LEPSM|nr:sepiapterin reductase-like [Lepeophtheirus salmonis]ADD38919.1 Sepiapterin reductase [Lepeophtheirus salmonis]
MKTNKKFVLVTGASKGFGKNIAIHWAKSCSSGSLMIITARSEEGLIGTESSIKDINPEINVVKFITDHGDPVKSDYEELFRSEISKKSKIVFDSGFIFHNVGVVEPQGDNVSEYSDLQEMEKYFRLNLFSMMILNSVFFNVREYVKQPLTIVNISSIAAFEPIASWGYYCMGKASRQMYFKIMAMEEENVRVLNYSPGVMNTSAIDRIKGSSKTTSDINTFCSDKLIEPIVSVKKLAMIIEKDKYKSGTQIDFADDI